MMPEEFNCGCGCGKTRGSGRCNTHLRHITQVIFRSHTGFPLKHKKAPGNTVPGSKIRGLPQVHSTTQNLTSTSPARLRSTSPLSQCPHGRPASGSQPVPSAKLPSHRSSTHASSASSHDPAALPLRPADYCFRTSRPNLKPCRPSALKRYRCMY